MFFCGMSIVHEIEKTIQPLLAQNSYELIETQYRKEGGRWILRIFVDRITEENDARSKISLEDCEKVSEMVGTLLDAEEFFSQPYTLEVSSPGINRALKKESHFLRSVGKKVKISLFAPLSPKSPQKNFSGTLISCREGNVEVDDSVSGLVKIPLSMIAKANLDII